MLGDRPTRAELLREEWERCQVYGHTLRREPDTGAWDTICRTCKTDVEAEEERLADQSDDAA